MKENGGFGVGNFVRRNEALLRQWGRFYQESEALSVDVIRSKDGLDVNMYLPRYFFFCLLSVWRGKWSESEVLGRELGWRDNFGYCFPCL